MFDFFECFLTTEEQPTLFFNLLVLRPNHGGEFEPNLIQIGGLELAHWIKMFFKKIFDALFSLESTILRLFEGHGNYVVRD